MLWPSLERRQSSAPARGGLGSGVALRLGPTIVAFTTTTPSLAIVNEAAQLLGSLGLGWDCASPACGPAARRFPCYGRLDPFWPSDRTQRFHTKRGPSSGASRLVVRWAARSESDRATGLIESGR